MAKLRPLWTPGGSRSSQRDATMPPLVTGALPNAQSYFQDFYDVAIGNAGWASGLTATPDTLVNLAPLGGPGWIATESAGTTGNVALGNSGSSYMAGCGLVQLTCGSTAGNAVHLDLAGSAQFTFSNTLSAIAGWRFGYPTAQTAAHNTGFGLVASSTAVGTNWLTDPNTTLAGTAALVFTRHEASYAGSAAGDLVARLYDTAGTYNASAVIRTNAGFVQNTAYRIEAVFDAAALALRIYEDSVLIATMPLTGLGSTKSKRPSFIQVATTAASRSIVHDYYFQEIQRATAR